VSGLAFVLALLYGLGPYPEARAAAGDTAAAAEASEAAWIAERQRLRTELDRVNAEIDALKRAGTGVRDDYRLRRRMADAEALARRLTDIDARLGAAARGGGSSGEGATGKSWPVAPAGAPGDDPGVLEAKADLLADQARRLSGHGDILAKRLADLRGRQELRRRAGQLERDPFSPMEQTKRRLIGDRAGSASEFADGGNGAPSPATRSGTTTTGSGAAPSTPPPGAPAVPGGQVTGDATAGGRNGEAQQPPGAAGHLPISSGVPGATGTGSVAAQFYGILDAATLAEIRRLEAPGSATASLQAMERALTAVRARAAQLDAEARTLRQRAKSPR
jgi:hypothetical protein